jgi:hypothetical protein
MLNKTDPLILQTPLNGWIVRQRSQNSGGAVFGGCFGQLDGFLDSETKSHVFCGLDFHVVCLFKVLFMAK